MALYDVVYVHHTSDAICVDDGVWLPLSKVHYDGDLMDLKPDQSIELEIPDWLALEKGLS